jgi:anti-sigma regulatory factor (Ser/Thr protein kinase)
VHPRPPAIRLLSSKRRRQPGSGSKRPSPSSPASNYAPRFNSWARCRVFDIALADHAEAVVREAVSNAVFRHSNATTLAVNVKVEDDLCIEVTDNGEGIPVDVTGSGLTNLLRWSAPLP